MFVYFFLLGYVLKGREGTRQDHGLLDPPAEQEQALSIDNGFFELQIYLVGVPEVIQFDFLSKYLFNCCLIARA